MSLLELTPPELVECAATAGFRCVNMRLSPAREGEEPYPMSPGSPMLADTLARMDGLGVTVSNVEVIKVGPETAPDDYGALFERSVAVGASQIITVSTDPDFDRATDTFARLCERAASFDLVLALEFMRFMKVADLASAAKMVRMTNAANARILPDVLHMARCGDTPEMLADLSDIIGFIQICDAPVTAPEDIIHEARFARLLPGEGELSVRAVLDAAPPETPVTVESPLDGARGKLPPLRRAQLTFDAVQRFIASTNA
ncbi:MAG: TIM barrel protein [Pseudomonadota bacterium]|nr:TIM barrel protein [Pseudomonadota bacterium]